MIVNVDTLIRLDKNINKISFFDVNVRNFLLDENVNIFLLEKNVRIFFLNLNASMFHWTTNINELLLLNENVNKDLNINMFLSD